MYRLAWQSSCCTRRCVCRTTKMLWFLQNILDNKNKVFPSYFRAIVIVCQWSSNRKADRKRYLQSMVVVTLSISFYFIAFENKKTHSCELFQPVCVQLCDALSAIATATASSRCTQIFKAIQLWMVDLARNCFVRIFRSNFIKYGCSKWVQENSD